MVFRRTRISSLIVVGVIGCLAALAQQPATPVAASRAVPPLVSFSGVLHDIDNKPIVGVTGVSFLLYKDQQGGSPLWIETQTVTPDENGRYSVTLGSGTTAGLPPNLFAAGESRWLAVQPHGETEQPRILILSVPYALKAGDAATVGGLPASAFMLANSNGASDKAAAVSARPMTAKGNSAAPVNPTVTGKGTLNFISMWDSTSDIINSLIFQKGTAVGINTTTPAASLDVNGKGAFRDTLILFPNTTDNTLSVSGTTFKVTSTGLVTFVAGQTFPGTGKGTITGVTTAAGSGLSGGGTSGTLNMKIPAAGVTNAMLASSKITLAASTAGGLTAPGAMNLGGSYTIGLKPCSANQILQFNGTAWNCAAVGTGSITGITAGTDLTGGGTTGNVTLNMDTTKVPQLSAANTFTGTEKFNANVGIGAAPFSNTYTPLALGGANGFGTWLSLANTSPGGHTWNILSAGSGNAEGAGNLGITDLTGTSTIWLEGNTNVSSNLTVTGSSAASTVDADYTGANAGGPTPGLQLGGSGSGEGIASNRILGFTRFGLDFYTNFTSRMSILQSGKVGVGTQNPGSQLSVVASSPSYSAIYAQSADVPGGSGASGIDGMDVFGGGGDSNSESTIGGIGIASYGGGGGQGGTGGVFQGADGFIGGFGVVGISGHTTGGGFNQEAGYFIGDVFATGSIDSGNAAMKIDHPLDPANKYLSHSAVESSDMKTMYDGTVTTDDSGQALVELPDWFEALNRDFRYQLTVVGQFAQAIVGKKIANHQFVIRTDKPNVEVCWLVTGIRQDAWANTLHTPVEQDKSDREKGFYLHPEVFGAPAEKGMAWARNPEMLQKRSAPLHSDAKAPAHGVAEKH